MKKSRLGFTLVEVLTVVAIIVLLTSLIVLVGNSVRNRSKIRATEANIKILEDAIELYVNDWRNYPSEAAAAAYAGASDAFYETPANVDAVNLALVAQLTTDRKNGPYLTSSKYLIDSNGDTVPDMFVDAFRSATGYGKALSYKRPGNVPAVTVNNEPNPDIFSAGPDGFYGAEVGVPADARDDNLSNYAD